MNIFETIRSALSRKKTDISVCVVIPTAGKHLWMLRRCLRKLRKAGRGLHLRTIIVLCPTDKHHEAAVRSVIATSDTLLCLPAPFSFARSNNAALAQLRDEPYVLFLNDDCFFKKSGDLLRLIRTIQNERLAYTGPWLEHWNFQSELPSETRSKGIARTSRPLIGACILCDRKWLETIGYFDPSFDGYGMEESDLSLRMLLQGGHWARDDRVVVDHVHHATVGGSIKSEEPHLRNLHKWQEKYPNIHSWGEGDPWQSNFFEKTPSTQPEAGMTLA